MDDIKISLELAIIVTFVLLMIGALFGMTAIATCQAGKISDEQEDIENETEALSSRAPALQTDRLTGRPDSPPPPPVTPVG
ncbi:MAG: hypothetical protein HUJ30_02725 [Gammaproteobacteria bacterium]|nr:hypothetical protein [Gammaproteobacteria bacterium]